MSHKNEIKIKRSDHIVKRLTKRAKIKHGSQDKFLNKALTNGITYENTTNNTIKDYIASITRKDCYAVIYQKYVIIFSKKNNVGITILNLPKQYWKIVDGINAKKEVKNNVTRKCNFCKGFVKEER